MAYNSTASVSVLGIILSFLNIYYHWHGVSEVEIPPLGIHLTQRFKNRDSDLCTQMFIVSLFTMGKYEWINKIWYMYTRNIIQP